MTSEDPSSLTICIRPRYDENGAASKLYCRQIFERPALSVGQSLCILYNKMGNGTTQCYTSDQIHAVDEQGHLDIITSDDGRTRSYRVGRETVGDVVINFTANPVQVGPKTPIGGRYELRKDQCGLQFMGISVIPIPWDESFTTKARYRLKLSWNLNDAPPETRAVSTFAEGPLERVGPPHEIWRMFFAVGPLRSHPPGDSPSTTFGFYWFGEAPKSIVRLPPLCEALFHKMSGFFNDDLSEQNSYRIFVRRATPARGFGGSAGIRSFMLDYDDSVDTIREYEIFNLLAHEMVHNWPLLYSTKDGDNDLVNWYNEGIADYYSSILPYRLGIWSSEQFITRINSKLTEYYTNPARLTPNREAQDKSWTSPDLQTLSYTRGMMYFCCLNAQIKQASDHSRSLDDLILHMLRKLRTGESCGLAEWKELLLQELGMDALKQFQEMNEGILIRLPANAFGQKYNVVRADQRELDYGFNASSLFTKQVEGLRSGSAAARAGMQEGDAIVKNSFVWQCQQDYNRSLILDVKRKENMVQIEYWPRSEDWVESWQVCAK